MKQTLLFMALALILCGMAGEELIREESKQCRLAAKEFKQKLQTALSGAIKEGGFTMALDVCKRKAPKIAAEISEKYQLEIKRVSLKYRNPDNIPDSWEEGVLKEFESALAKGEHPDTLVRTEIVEVEGRCTFRFMKGISTGGICLTCHGTEIKPALIEKLDKLYPGDRARGFKKGDIRGAVSIRKPL